MFQESLPSTTREKKESERGNGGSIIVVLAEEGRGTVSLLSTCHTERSKTGRTKEDDGGQGEGVEPVLTPAKQFGLLYCFYSMTLDRGRIYCLSARQLANVDVGRSGQSPQVEHLNKIYNVCI